MQDLKRLHEIASSSPEAIEVFSQWSQYERNVKHINISRFRSEMRKAGHKIDRDIYLKVLRDLESEGWGKIVVGPRGGLVRFDFKGGRIYDIGAKGLGVAPKASSIELHPVGTIKPRVQGKIRPTWIVLCIPMGDGSLFKTHVPNTLTKEDARRIGQALQEIAR